jgi:hypothetical protein
MINTKICSKCGEPKELSEYTIQRNYNNHTYVRSSCKKCNTIQAQIRIHSSPEKQARQMEHARNWARKKRLDPVFRNLQNQRTQEWRKKQIKPKTRICKYCKEEKELGVFKLSSNICDVCLKIKQEERVVQNRKHNREKFKKDKESISNTYLAFLSRKPLKEYNQYPSIMIEVERARLQLFREIVNQTKI